MCRWAAYIGTPIFLSDVLCDPGHSLIKQSQLAMECKTPTNGDGFGLAWYDHRPEPGQYRDVYPAWADPNLRSLAEQVRSGLFMAHVRASTGTATSRNNCHPFVVGQHSFVHNGQVGGYDQFRKGADMLIPDHLYAHRKGATDSEAVFLVACGLGLAQDAHGAMMASVAQFEAMSRATGKGPHMRLSAALADGDRLYAIRYASDDKAPSLYYRQNDNREGWTVVSEPLETQGAGWQAVPAGSFCSFDRTRVTIQPFAPEVSQRAA